MNTGLLRLHERRQLRDLLLAIRGMRNPQTRDQLIEGLPATIVNRIEFSYEPRSHISNIIRDTNGPGAILSDGTWSIMIVIENAIHMTKDLGLQEKFQQLRAALEQRLQKAKQSGDEPDDDHSTDLLSDLQLQVEEDRADIAQICYILHLPNPGYARLSQLPRVTGLRDIVLAELVRLNPDARLFKPLSYHEADAWLDSARKHARAADSKLSLAYRQATELLGMTPGTTTYQRRLDSASAASDEAHQRCDDLHAQIDHLLAIYAAQAPQGTDSEANRSEAAK